MKELARKCRELGRVWFEGEVTVTKVNLWLALTTCLLAGIVYGLRKASCTPRIMVGCNNNSFGCDHGKAKTSTDSDQSK